MSKRFIDTNLFDDPWFMELSIKGKLLWIYFITKCDHAGILELNVKLAKFQTEIKDIETVIKELSDRLITVKENLYFIPKYIEFQYPNFPNSTVRQQESAIKILTKLGLYDESNLTVSQVLSNTSVNDSVNDTVTVNGDVNGKKPDFFDRVLKIWIDCYYQEREIEYEVTAKRKETSAISKLLTIYKKRKPESDTETTLKDFETYFRMCLNIEDAWLNENMSIPIMLSQYNKIQTILKNGKQRGSKNTGVSDSEIEAIAEYFYPDKKN